MRPCVASRAARGRRLRLSGPAPPQAARARPERSCIAAHGAGAAGAAARRGSHTVHGRRVRPSRRMRRCARAQRSCVAAQHPWRGHCAAGVTSSPRRWSILKCGTAHAPGTGCTRSDTLTRRPPVKAALMKRLSTRFQPPACYRKRVLIQHLSTSFCLRSAVENAYLKAA